MLAVTSILCNESTQTSRFTCQLLDSYIVIIVTDSYITNCYTNRNILHKCLSTAWLDNVNDLLQIVTKRDIQIW